MLLPFTVNISDFLRGRQLCFHQCLIRVNQWLKKIFCKKMQKFIDSTTNRKGAETQSLEKNELCKY